jgi:vancomycin permeability regulator SanA
MRALRAIVILFLIILITGFFHVVGVVSIMRTTAANYTHTEQKTLPDKRVGIVFGAAVRRDGSLSPILQDRVLAGVELLKEGKVAKLLMTGDNGSRDYDEVSAMKRTAIAAGAAEDEIVLDYAGFSTYDSCYRAKEIFGVNEAILITQRFHLARALYLCRKKGINAEGLALEDFSKYPDLRVNYSVREYAASYKAWLDITILKPKPRFLGKFEGPI